MTRKTLDNWENGLIEKRKLLYEVLKAIPPEFVEDVKRKMEYEKELKSKAGELSKS